MLTPTQTFVPPATQGWSCPSGTLRLSACRLHLRVRQHAHDVPTRSAGPMLARRGFGGKRWATVADQCSAAKQQPQRFEARGSLLGMIASSRVTRGTRFRRRAVWFGTEPRGRSALGREPLFTTDSHSLRAPKCNFCGPDRRRQTRLESRCCKRPCARRPEAVPGSEDR
jgi:hypothetical protein